jgi:pimeloyl-ACP methyl ester carboxylesterase
MTALDGSADRIELGREVYVQAPGLVGSVELLEPNLLGTRAGEQRATSALTSALDRQQFTTVHSLEINTAPAAGPVAPTNRGSDDRPLLTLEVPDIGPEQPQVVLLADEEGVVTWHFAQPASMPNMVRFDVPADTVAAPTQPTPVQQRGLVSLIGKKLLSVLVFHAIEAGAQVLAQVLAERWESLHRPSRLRRFAGPDDCATVIPLDDRGWTNLTGGRALLFIHGTFSTSQGGFGALDGQVWRELSQRYNGRVFAFDHPTLSVDPLANVETLKSLVPSGAPLNVDIVAHSRGGLVARALACEAAGGACPLHVNKIVHIGVPNAGTALADFDRHAKFLDRISTLLNLAPDGPLSVVADIFDGLLTMVKIIGCKAIGALPGLIAMDPADEWLKKLGSRQSPPYTAYSIGADYEPTGGMLRLVRVPDSLADAVFGFAPNDMIVPAVGVYDAAATLGFPIPQERRVAFTKSEAVWHCAYIGREKTQQALLGWLTGDNAAGAEASTPARV